MADFSKYNDGARGGKVRIRAKIVQEDKKTLMITEIPFGTTTASLIETIVTANDKGKIKIRKIEDNTAEKVEIIIHLAPGVSPDTTIDALYAFTACESSVSPICCVIENQKPKFITVHEILEKSVQHTLDLLQHELEIEKAECLEQLHFATLERIFIEKEVYQLIKKSKTDQEINETIDKGLKPYVKLFIRPVTIEDIHRLRKIPIERISKYNSDKAKNIIESLNDDIAQVEYDLDHLVDYAIAYYERIRMKYAAGRERRTEIRNFDVIQATLVAAANQKLYINREEGFIGTGIKKDEFVCECSDIDDIITFRADGTFMLTKVSEKLFVGKNIIHAAVYKRYDDRTIFNMVYQDGRGGPAMVKRFAVMGVNRDKEYVLTKGKADSKVLYFTANPNGEAEVITVHLRPKPRLKILNFDFDFSTLAIKGRNSIGNILTKNPVRKITLKGEGVSTLSARDLWYDDTVKRINTEQRGKYLGAFEAADKIIAFMKSGHFRIYNCDLSVHFDEDLFEIEKYNPEKTYTVIYFDGELGYHFVKRFNIEYSEKKTSFVGDTPESYMVEFMSEPDPSIELFYITKNLRSKPSEIINLKDFIGVKSHKAKGKRLSNNVIQEIKRIIPETPDSEISGENETPEIPEEKSPTPDKQTTGRIELKDIHIEETSAEEENTQAKEEKRIADRPIKPKKATEKETRQDTSEKKKTSSEKNNKKKNSKTKKGKDFPGAIQIEFEF